MRRTNVKSLAILGLLIMAAFQSRARASDVIAGAQPNRPPVGLSQPVAPASSPSSRSAPSSGSFSGKLPERPQSSSIMYDSSISSSIDLNHGITGEYVDFGVSTVSPNGSGKLLRSAKIPDGSQAVSADIQPVTSVPSSGSRTGLSRFISPRGMPVAILVIGALYLRSRRRRHQDLSIQTIHPLSNSALEIGTFEPLRENLIPRPVIENVIVGLRR